MSKENPKLDQIIQLKINEIQSNFLPYLKIIALSFIIPMWGVIVVNGLAIIWKMAEWLKSDEKFWTNQTYIGLTIILLLIIPIGYLLWFYYLTTKRTLLQLYNNFLIDWNREIGSFCAQYLIELETKDIREKEQFDIAVILTYINKKLSQLPRILQWVVRKLVDAIPFVAFVNSFSYDNLKTENKEKLADSITQKIDEFELDFIESVVPQWCMIIIPLNLILLITYLSL